MGGCYGKLIQQTLNQFENLGSYSSQAKVNHSLLVQNKVVCKKCTSEHRHDFRRAKTTPDPMVSSDDSKKAN